MNLTPEQKQELHDGFLSDCCINTYHGFRVAIEPEKVFNWWLSEIEKLQANQWISVEEKPKPELPVIVYGINECGKGRTLRATWIPKFYMEDKDKFLGTTDYNEEKDMYYWPEGWYEWNDVEETHWLISFPVIKWMPLPDPPQSKK